MAEVEKKENPEEQVPAKQDTGKENPNPKDNKRKGFWQKAGDLGKKALKSPTFWGAILKLGSTVLKAFNHPKWWGGNDQKITGAGGMYATTYSANKYNMVNAIGCVGVNFNQVIDLSFVDSDIDSLITALNTKVGFNTGLTSANFKTYITACAQAYITLISYLRDYNGAEYKTVGAKKIGDMINGANYTATNKPTISIGKTMYHYTGGADTVRREVRRISIDSISNHDYEQIIAKLDNMKLSQNMKELIEYMFGAFFSNGIESGVNSLIIFDDIHNIPTSTDMGTVPSELKYSYRLNSCISAIDNAIAACPYVEQLAEVLGFTNISLRETVNNRDVIMKDYTRNVTQNVINVAADDSMVVALENMTSENLDAANDTFYILTHSEDLTYSTEKDKWSTKTVGEIGSWLKLVYMSADWYALSCLVVNNTYAGAFVNYKTVGAPIASQTANILGTATLSALTTKMAALSDITGFVDYHQVLGIANTDGYSFKVVYQNDAGGSTINTTISTATSAYNAAGADVFKHTQYTLIKALNQTAITMGLDYRQPMVEFIRSVSRDSNKMLNR